MLLLIIPSFIFFGVQGYSGFNDAANEAVAKVDGQDIKRAEDLTFEQVAKDRLIAGSAAECLEQLQMWQAEIKPDYLMLRMRQLGEPPQPEALRDIRLFGEQVLTKL